MFPNPPSFLNNCPAPQSQKIRDKNKESGKDDAKEHREKKTITA
jgi:hypothetical protein